MRQSSGSKVPILFRCAMSDIQQDAYARSLIPHLLYEQSE